MKELCGYYPTSILSRKPTRLEIAINGEELIGVPKAEWLAILPLLTKEQWREIYLKVYALGDGDGQ